MWSMLEGAAWEARGALAVGSAGFVASRACWRSRRDMRGSSIGRSQAFSSRAAKKKKKEEPIDLGPIKPTFDFAYWSEHEALVQKNADDKAFKCDVAEVIRRHKLHQKILYEIKDLQTQRNANGKKMKGKLEPEERNSIIEEGKRLKEQAASKEEEAEKLLAEVFNLAKDIPNIVHPDAPRGPEENAIELRVVGTPRTSESAGFALKDHMQIGEALDLFDFASGGKVSGSSFFYMRRGAALLEIALVQWAMHEATARGFTPMMTPDLVRNQVVAGCGFQPRDDEASQIYEVANSDLCLAGTAEIPLAGTFMNEILVADRQKFPIKLAAFGHAFRTEVGSARKETRGIYRVHQFSKVELFAVTTADLAESERMMSEIRELEEDLYTQLGICFRVLDMPTEELGAPAYRKFDMEAWMPGMGRWGEISSCSNCTDYQARRLNIRYKETILQKGGLAFPHTLNGTAVAVPRLLIAIIETYQNSDGSVTVPEVLRKYMPAGMDTLRPEA